MSCWCVNRMNTKGRGQNMHQYMLVGVLLYDPYCEGDHAFPHRQEAGLKSTCSEILFKKKVFYTKQK